MQDAIQSVLRFDSASSFFNQKSTEADIDKSKVSVSISMVVIWNDKGYSMCDLKYVSIYLKQSLQSHSIGIVV